MRLFGTGSFIDMREKKRLWILFFFFIDESLFSCLHGGFHTNLHLLNSATPSCGGENDTSHLQGVLVTLFHCSKLLLSQYDGGVEVIPVWQDRKILPCVWARVCADRRPIMHRRQCVTGEGLT